MTISTYAELKTEVADWAHRSDLTAKMDTFCQFAEQIINNGFELNGRTVGGLRSKEMVKRSSQSFNATFFALPSDYLEMIALEIEYSGGRVPIRQVSQQILDSTYSTATGNPRAFSIIGDEIEFRPGIDAASPYTGEITYYAAVPTLVTNSTNNILSATPMVYLAAMLLAVAIYLQDDEMAATWFNTLASYTKGANKTAGQNVLPTIQVM